MRTHLIVLLLVSGIAACGDDTTAPPEDGGVADSALVDSAADAPACTDDIDCIDGNACNGTETCDALTRTCVTSGPIDCDDLDPCTSDSCDMAAGCVNTLEDADMDGYAPAVSCTTADLKGGDCNDADDAVHPGASELCDMLDNDCNGLIDDAAMLVTCLRDRDGDGYGDPSMTMTACECPEGFIPPRADSETDCADHVVFANPGQTAPSGMGYCPIPDLACLASARSFDWNCDGRETPLATLATGCELVPGTMTCTGAGFRGDDEACGALRNYQGCGYDGDRCQLIFSPGRPQPCL